MSIQGLASPDTGLNRRAVDAVTAIKTRSHPLLLPHGNQGSAQQVGRGGHQRVGRVAIALAVDLGVSIGDDSSRSLAAG